MTVKHISEIIGELGKWQLNICAFYFTMYILSPYNNLGISFHAPKVSYWCADNGTTFDASVEHFNNDSNDSGVCKTCEKWAFDDYYGKTIISEFDLVCDKSWLPSLSQSFYQIGYVVNGLLLGYLSDRYGRRPVLWLALGIEICGGLSIIFSETMFQYIFSKLLLGLGDSGRGVCLYLLVLETVGPKYRSDVVMTVNFGWILGYISLPAFAYLLMDFRYLQAIPTVLAIVLMSTWLWSIPESPRWQIANNRIDSAHKSIERAVKMNGQTLSADIYAQLSQMKFDSQMNQSKSDKHLTIIDLLSAKELRKYCLIFWFSFAINAFIYHGISLNIGQIGGNLYINFAIAGLVEIPSIILNIVGLKHMGRKPFTVCTMLLASISYTVIVLLTAYKSSIDRYYHTLKLMFAMFGKLFIFSSFNAIYIHSGEVFPTVLRHTGIGSCSIAARIGSILAPFVKEMTEYSNLGLSMLIFSVLSFMATLLTLFLPETKDREIPDSMTDVEDLNK